MPIQTDNFESAKEKCDKLRRALPAIYNIARLFETPLPILNPPQQPDVDEQLAADRKVALPTVLLDQNDAIAFETIFNDNFDHELDSDNEPTPDQADSDPLADNDQQETVSEDEASVLEESFEAQPESSSYEPTTNDADTNNLGPENDSEDGGSTVASAVDDGGAPSSNLKTMVVDDDITITFDESVPLIPMQEGGYQIKINDELSKNIPFKENVCISDLIYKVLNI